MQFYSDCQDHLPPTFREDMKGRVAPLDQKNLSKPWFPFPLFVEVENGRKYVHAEAPDLNFWDFVPYTYSFYPATVTHVFVDKHAKIFESPALCKESSNVAPHHHLEHGTSQLIYIISLGMWTVLSILHDSALLLVGGLEHDFDFSRNIGNLIIPKIMNSNLFQMGLAIPPTRSIDYP